jgi:hypothetical protein
VIITRRDDARPWSDQHEVGVRTVVARCFDSTRAVRAVVDEPVHFVLGLCVAEKKTSGMSQDRKNGASLIAFFVK